MVVKAVHIEVVSSLTTEAFLAAFSRFTARRASCKVIYSDNGTTFQGADAELRRLFDATSAFSQQAAAAIAQDGLEWSFIPPRAPNFGGLWEANVKSFKRHLYRIIGEHKLTYEEFSTVVARIEACLNSRPLSPISPTDGDLAALTPGHFLIGAALTSSPEPFDEINEPNYAGSRWRLLRLMRNYFWKRWKQEYLSQLQGRSKWQQVRMNLKEGDVVLFKDELTPPTKWPLARIVQLHYGNDGLARVATLKMEKSVFKRPVNKLILLPVNDAITAHYTRVRSMVGGPESADPSTLDAETP